MILTQKNAISFFHFPNLSRFSHINHGIFTRNQGYSKRPYNSLNIGLGVGDDDETVRKNRELISICMGGRELVFVNQVHGNDILILKKDSPDKRHFPMTGDAIITDIPGKNLVIQTADCQAVLLYDAVKRVAANVHSGWRGSICNIIGKTVQAMKEIFGCDSSDIFAGIGPGLGPCCAEFIHYEKEIPLKYWKYKTNLHHFDFRAISKDQLCSQGIPEENIYSTELCTKCRTDLFFSYRGEGNTGRFASIIGIK